MEPIELLQGYREENEVLKEMEMADIKSIVEIQDISAEDLKGFQCCLIYN